MLTTILLLLLTTSTFTIFSQEIEIPDDFQPIEGTSEILYSYEFDDKPKFMDRISDSEFIIFDIHDEEAKIFLYNIGKNSVELKSEFIINELESLDDYRIDENKLILLFKNYAGRIGNKNEGSYWRETIVDLNTFQPITSEIIYTTIDINLFEIDEYNDDLSYANNDIDTSMFLLYTRGSERIEIEPREYTSFYDTYNQNDSSMKSYLSFVHEQFSRKLYARATFFDPDGNNTKSFLVEILDSTEQIRTTGVHWTYLDDNSNLYFLFSWHDKHLSKRFITFNRISPNGAYRYYYREIDTELEFDDDYVIHEFETFSKNGNIHKAMGVARLSGSEALQVQPVVGMYLAEFNLETLEFNLQRKEISKLEGNKLNNDEDYLKFNIINRVIETNDGYVVLAEHNKVHNIYHSAKPRGIGLNYKSNHHYHSINLFKLDKNLNFIWNKHIEDRNLHGFRGVWGQSRNSVNRYANHVTLRPTFEQNNFSFTYSSKKDTLIKRVTYNIEDGSLIEEIPLFKNDQISSYCPGYQFPVGKNEFITLLIEDDYYLVRYKLLK